MSWNAAENVIFVIYEFFYSNFYSLLVSSYSFRLVGLVVAYIC